MAKTSSPNLTNMDGASIAALWNRKQKATGLMFPPRLRKESNTVISLVKLDKLPSYAKNPSKAVSDALGINNHLIDGRAAGFAAICHTHNSACLASTRHQATFALRKTSAKDARTDKQRLESKGLKPFQIGWCKGCVSAYEASL